MATSLPSRFHLTSTLFPGPNLAAASGGGGGGAAAAAAAVATPFVFRKGQKGSGRVIF